MPEQSSTDDEHDDTVITLAPGVGREARDRTVWRTTTEGISGPGMIDMTEIAGL